jgi:hypothetical protein
MTWILVLYFACGVGCAEPASAARPLVYDTEQECTEAGNERLRTLTVARFACKVAPNPKSLSSEELDKSATQVLKELENSTTQQSRTRVPQLGQRRASSEHNDEGRPSWRPLSFEEGWPLELRGAACWMLPKFCFSRPPVARDCDKLSQAPWAYPSKKRSLTHPADERSNHETG